MDFDEAGRLTRLQGLMDVYQCDEDVAELLLEDELENLEQKKETPGAATPRESR